MRKSVLLYLCVVVLLIFTSSFSIKKPNLQSLIEETLEKYASVDQGKNADYIPYLAEVNPNLFAISVVDLKGNLFSTGDSDFEFGIESISKVMLFSLALEQNDAKTIERLIGVDATGQPFNSVLALETIPSRTVNPFVNAGAIATNSIVLGSQGRTKDQTIDAYMEDFCGRRLSIIEELFLSEMETNQHNVGISVLLESYNRMYADPYESTRSYTRQCSYAITSNDLAIMAAVLANNGINPVTGKRVLKPENVTKVLAVMATAGLYDTSGEWLYYVGLPAKSGVGGGIMAVAPGKYGIAVFSPPLDKAGNSVKAQMVIKDLSEKLNLNVFKP
jgi:glutaminase